MKYFLINSNEFTINNYNLQHSTPENNNNHIIKNILEFLYFLIKYFLSIRFLYSL